MYFEDMFKGKVFDKVYLNEDEDEIIFESKDGTIRMYHDQDCCEYVYVESIVGELSDLVGVPIQYAEEYSKENPDASESGTWTFYKFATIKGYVDIRWYGSSNGYYSERVDCVFTPKRDVH